MKKLLCHSCRHFVVQHGHGNFKKAATDGWRYGCKELEIKVSSISMFWEVMPCSYFQSKEGNPQSNNDTPNPQVDEAKSDSKTVPVKHLFNRKA